MSGDANLDLVREMGADWYDPIPPDQYMCFVEEDFRLTDRGHRFLAAVRSWTIRGQKGKRTAYAKDGKRMLKVAEIGARVGLDASASRKVANELIEHGLIREDERGRVWLCGKVKAPEQTKGEDSPDLTEDQVWQKFCTDNFAGYLAKQFQQLSKNERPNLWQDTEVFEAFEKQVAAQAIAAAREQVQRIKDRHFEQRYGVKVRRFERKGSQKNSTDEQKEPKPQPIVQLSLLAAPSLSVQNSEQNSIQDGNPDLYKQKNGSVQTTLIKETNFFSNSSSELTSSSSKEEKAARATTTTPKPVPIKREQRAIPEPERTAATVHEALQKACPGETIPRDLAEQLVALTRRKDPHATAAQIASVIFERSLKRRHPGAGFFLRAVPECFPLAKKPAAAEASSEQPQEDRAERIRELKTQLADPELSEAERVIVQKLLRLAEDSQHADERAMKAGSV